MYLDWMRTNMTAVELYIHIPFCIKKCNYCDFLSDVFPERIQEEYALCLCKEIKYMASLYPDVKVSTIFVGGGTPSWLDENLMDKIITTVFSAFDVLPQAEVTIEANPGTLSSGKLNLYRSIGINRISIGLQSANDDELKELGRIHDYNKFLHTYDLIRKAGFDNINVDLMTGLPHQTVEKLDHTLNAVTLLRPEHISAYSLIVEEGTPFFDKYHQDLKRQEAGEPTLDGLPTDEDSYKLYKYATSYLEKKGYKRYEISNYCRPGKECLHNIGYWSRTPYIGLGLGASSLINDTRASNIRDIYKYMEIASRLDYSLDYCNNPSSPLWNETVKLSKNDMVEEFMYLGLRKTEGISKNNFGANFGKDISAYYGNQIEALKKQGFLDEKDDMLFLTDLGTDLSNQVLSQFLLD